MKPHVSIAQKRLPLSAFRHPLMPSGVTTRLTLERRPPARWQGYKCNTLSPKKRLNQTNPHLLSRTQVCLQPFGTAVMTPRQDCPFGHARAFESKGLASCTLRVPVVTDPLVGSFRKLYKVLFISGSNHAAVPADSMYEQARVTPSSRQHLSLLYPRPPPAHTSHHTHHAGKQKKRN